MEPAEKLKKEKEVDAHSSPPKLKIWMGYPAHIMIYFDKNIKIDQKLYPENLNLMIKEIEDERENQHGIYFDLVDNFDTVLKNAYASGEISKKTWKLFMKKYKKYADYMEAVMKTEIYDLNNYPLSVRNGSYGGASGSKESIKIGNGYWIVKYPKSTEGLNRPGSLSYTTSPLSEYIGSHIYAILGYKCHDTILGVRDNKVVVACRDFCNDDERLLEFRQLKNTYNDVLNEALSESLTSTGNNHFADLNAIKIHLKYNPELNNIPGIQERFWDCCIIDGLINNNDRNDGNWGVIRNNKGETRIAPVYDNGGSFSAKTPDSKLKRRLNDPSQMKNYLQSCITAYSIDGEHNLPFRKLLKINDEDLKEAIVRVVPLIKEKLSDIKEFINGIPDYAGKYTIISDLRRRCYISEIEDRVSLYLEPAYEKASAEIMKEKRQSIPHQNRWDYDDFER